MELSYSTRLLSDHFTSILAESFYILLVTKFELRLTLGLLWLHLAGTFLVFILRPDLAFQNGNLLLLTDAGEFIIKNFVLISAGIVIGSTVRRQEATQSSLP